MSEYYAVQRSGECLAHYGVKGMRWGVRKAIGSGNDRALNRQFKKASKKLAKLEKQAASGKKYAKRAAAYGAGAAALGSAAVLGSKSNISKGIYGAAGKLGKFKEGAQLARKVGGAYDTNAWKSATNAAYSLGGKTGNFKAGAQAARKIEGARSGLQNSIYKTAGEAGKFKEGAQLARKAGNLNSGQVARVGAGLVGAGLGVAAARNAYKAATTKRTAKKAAQFRSEMQKAFKGTKYANQMPAQYQPKKRRKSR